jgi:5'-nucleotidase
VKKFLSLNGEAKDSERVEVVLLSRNSADTGLRIFNSIQYYGLDISKAAFANENTPHKYVPAFGVDLFLSAEPSDVRVAFDMGVAATILPTKEQSTDQHSSPLKIAFDGDAVLFSDEAEKVFQKEGLGAFNRSEKESSDKPLAGGPFAGFFSSS